MTKAHTKGDGRSGEGTGEGPREGPVPQPPPPRLVSVGDPPSDSLTEREKALVKNAVRSALGYRGAAARGRGPEASTKNGEGDPDVDLSPKDLLTQADTEARLMNRVLARVEASDRLMTRSTPGLPVDPRIAILEDRLARSEEGRRLAEADAREARSRAENDARDAKVRIELQELRQIVAASSKGDGASFGGILPKDAFDFARSYAKDIREEAHGRAETNELDLKRDQLGLQWNLWQAKQAAQEKFEAAKLQAEVAQQDRASRQISDLASLARDAISGTLKPVTEQLGQGMREFVSKGGRGAAAAAPPGVPPSAPPVQQAPASPEQEREQILSQIRALSPADRQARLDNLRLHLKNAAALEKDIEALDGGTSA